MVEPRLLLLRLWPDETPFRAVAREFEPEQSRHFDDPQALVDFVLGLPVPMAPSAPARPQDDQARSKRRTNK